MAPCRVLRMPLSDKSDKSDSSDKSGTPILSTIKDLRRRSDGS